MSLASFFAVDIHSLNFMNFTKTAGFDREVGKQHSLSLLCSKNLGMMVVSSYLLRFYTDILGGTMTKIASFVSKQF